MTTNVDDRFAERHRLKIVINEVVIATMLRHPSQKVIGSAVIATMLRHPSQKVIGSAVITQSV
jgi:hypothetical protein